VEGQIAVPDDCKAPSSIQVEPEKVLPPATNVLEAPNSNSAPVETGTISAEPAPIYPLPDIVETNASEPSQLIKFSLDVADVTPEFKSEDLLPKAVGKRTWITPFALGLITSVAFMALVGAISMKFGRDFLVKMLSGNPVQQLAESTPASLPRVGTEIAGNSSSDIKTTDSTHLSTQSATRNRDAPTDASTPKQSASDRSPEMMGAHPKIISPKTSHEKTQTFPKALAPRPVPVVRTSDVIPPAFTLPTNSEAPRLPEVFSAPPAPAPSVNVPAKPSGKLVAAQLVVRHDPVYPADAKIAHFSGPVELTFIIKADGGVRNVRVTKGNPVLGRAAVEAVQTWRFLPARRDGVPVETDSATVIYFKLN
jgi:protein TonB